MKCSNCQNELISIFRCRYCSKTVCSLKCLELHCSNFHSVKNNTSTSLTRINSPYLLKGFLNSTIVYDSFYSLDNFVPIYDEKGKVQIIGSGSYGQVYLALHILNKKYYAIKHMDKKKLFSLLHSLNSIQKEIDIQSKIDHPNIVKLLYVKETHISYDLVMEYASMGNLFHYIRKYKGLNEDKTFSLFIQVVNAVNFMHSNDLIHRDIKPENILIFDNNIIRLCDFGWCVKLEGHQRGTFCGTTEYMSPELVNHQGYGKEIDVWSLGILLYEMIHGYSPFRPNKPKFNEKEVMENIKNHNLIFGKTVSDECKNLIYHLLDPDINKRYNVEDIYNSDFVKKYEKMNYCFPDINLVQLYNKKIRQNNEQNLFDNINKNDENININNLNNIITSNIEINKNNLFNSNNRYLNNRNNYQMQESRNIYNTYNDNNPKYQNFSNYDLTRDNYFINMNKNATNKQNLNEFNKYSNYLNIFSNEPKNEISKKELDNIFNNNEKQNMDLYNFNDNERHPQDNEKYINYNNNSFFILMGDNETNNMKIKNGEENYLNKINDKLWNNSINNNNIPNDNNISNNQYIEINQKEISHLNNQSQIKNVDNKSVNYNYYYNFNNYNNNYTNNFFNHNYDQISPNSLSKKILVTNYNINSLNQNSNNSNINIIIDKIHTPSTIPTSDKANQGGQKIIIKQKKISEFDVGEEKYNLSDREQNENEHSAIKINLNHEQQKINNRKYLSRSDYSIMNKKKKEEKVKNIFIKKLDIGEIKLDNFNQINNSQRINHQKEDNSDIERVEQYLLKNKIYKNKKDSNYKIMKNISEPNIKENEVIINKFIKIPNSNITKRKKIKRLLSERNINEMKDKGRNQKLEKENIIMKINKEKVVFNEKLGNKKNISKNNNQIKKDDSNKKENYIGDLLCSIFNVFDSKKDKKNEINIMDKESKYNNNTHKSLITKLKSRESSNKNNNINYTKSNSFIRIEKDSKKNNKNSSFIRINNKKNKVISLGLSQFEDSEPNDKKKIKNVIYTQPNLDVKENNKNILNTKNILRNHFSSLDIKIKNNEKEQKRNHKIIEIPINSKCRNIKHKNIKNLNDTNLNNSIIITPKKKNIFNRVHPFKLIGAFKKELTDYSQQKFEI